MIYFSLVLGGESGVEVTFLGLCRGRKVIFSCRDLLGFVVMIFYGEGYKVRLVKGKGVWGTFEESGFMF